MTYLIRIDKDKLSKVAGVSFTDRDICELVAACTEYKKRSWQPALKKFMLKDIVQRSVHERQTRQSFVEEVRGIWDERRRKRGRGSSYSRHKGRFDGPLIRLLADLFKAMDESPPNWATLHTDILAAETGVQRNR
jgi:hypothetical protein